MTVPVMLRKPSGFLSVGMSLAALVVVLAHVIIFGKPVRRMREPLPTSGNS